MNRSHSVLVIDDNADDFYLIKRQLLKSKAYKEEEIFYKEDGQYGLDFLKDFENNKSTNPSAFPPGLIFLDINMPRMGGHEFLTEFDKLSGGEKYKDTIIIMYSTSNNESDKEKVKNYDFVKGYVTKAITKEKLEKILTILDSS